MKNKDDLQASVDKKLNKVILYLMIGVMVSLSIAHINSSFLNLGYPYNSLLFWAPNDIFADFKYTFVAHPAPYASVGLGSGYFPFMYFLVRLLALPFIFFPKVALSSLIAMLTLFITSTLLLIKNYCKELSGYFNPLTLLIFIFSFGTWFCIERGNFEMLIFLLIFAFFVFYSKRQYYKSAFVLAMAIASKLHPAILSLLFLADKKYKEFFTCAGLSLFFMFFPLLTFRSPKGILPQITNMFANLDFFTQAYTTSKFSLAFNHSLLVGIKTFLYLIKKDLNIFFNQEFLPPYLILVFIIFVPVFYYTIFVKDDFWKKSFVLLCSSSLLPHASIDYTLMYSILPLIMFIYNGKSEGKLDNVYIALFVLILIPMNWWFLEIPTTWWYNPLAGTKMAISVAALMLRPFVMLSFLLLLISRGIWTKFAKSKIAKS